MNGYALTPIAGAAGVVHAVQGAVAGGWTYGTVCGQRVEARTHWSFDSWRSMIVPGATAEPLCPFCVARWERVLAEYAARVREVRVETDAAHARIQAGEGTAEDWALTYND